MAMVTANLKNTESYIDDVLTHSVSIPQHLRQIEALLQRMIQYQLKLNIQKCEFLPQEMEYLGYTISKDGVKPGKAKAQVIKDAKPPTTIKQIQSFIGLANYFRQLIPNFSTIAAPLNNLISKKTKWTSGNLPPEALTAFKELQQK